MTKRSETTVAPGVQIRNNKGWGIHISFAVSGRRERVLLRHLPHTEEGIAEAIRTRERYIQFVRTGCGHPKESAPSASGDIAAAIDAAFTQARRRAKSKGISYTLTPDQEELMALNCSGKCALTGIEFSTDRLGYRRTPYAPSLDRIHSKYGYEPDNVRLICVAANYAMNEWGESVLARVASGYVDTVVAPHRIPKPAASGAK